jgi:cystathionine beta-lyase
MTDPTTTRYNFDTPRDRRGTNSIKWDRYPDDVLPLWVAEMDFPAPPPVRDALHDRIDHGFFGYTDTPDTLRELIVERLQRLYNWQVRPSHVVVLPGMVVMLNQITRAAGKMGDGVLMQTPVYGPFLTVPENQHRFAQMADLVAVDDGDSTFHYEIDFTVLESAITRQTSLFLLCNPHNPAGRIFNRNELLRMAEMCIENDVVICEDAIHADLLMDDNTFTPAAALSEEIAQHTVTLFAPTKTYNIPGLPCSIAIIPDDELRQRVEGLAQGSGLHVGPLSCAAAVAAYADCDEWLNAVRRYITANRDFAVNFIREHLAPLKTTVPQATFLLWLDCSALPVDDPQAFFLKEARVALNPGTFFSPDAEQFVRLNVACPRPILEKALYRIKDAIDAL